MTRTATRRRETGETSVEVSVNLDGSGNNEIAFCCVSIARSVSPMRW